jgi:hypothetical protein
MTKPTISLQELRAKIGQRAKSAPAHARDLAGSGGVAPWCTARGVSFETTAWCTGARKHALAERTHNPDGRRLRGEPDAGNPPVRFDVAGAGDGVMDPLNGHEAGNGGHSQGESCTPPRRSPTRLLTPTLLRGEGNAPGPRERPNNLLQDPNLLLRIVHPSRPKDQADRRGRARTAARPAELQR